MPKYWYDYRSIEKPENDDKEAVERYELNRRIVANKKPYFMRYIYPNLQREYKTFVKKAELSCVVQFGFGLSELLNTPEFAMSEEMRIFLEYYNNLNPVSTNNCVMNRICRAIEAAFSAESNTDDATKFDYAIMKSGVEYNAGTYHNFKALYDEHRKKLASVTINDGKRVTSKRHMSDYRTVMMDAFCRKGAVLCSNLKEASDIVLDMCYKTNNTKQFAWDIVADGILNNLLAKSGGVVMYPILDPDGDIEYRGDTYSMTRMEVERDGYCYKRKGMAADSTGEERHWAEASTYADDICEVPQTEWDGEEGDTEETRGVAS